MEVLIFIGCIVAVITLFRFGLKLGNGGRTCYNNSKKEHDFDANERCNPGETTKEEDVYYPIEPFPYECDNKAYLEAQKHDAEQQGYR